MCDHLSATERPTLQELHNSLVTPTAKAGSDSLGGVKRDCIKRHEPRGKGQKTQSTGFSVLLTQVTEVVAHSRNYKNPVLDCSFLFFLALMVLYFSGHKSRISLSSFTKWGRQWYTPCMSCYRAELKQHTYKLSFYICNTFNTQTTLTYTYHRKHIKHYLHASCVSVTALTYLDYTYTDTEAYAPIYALT